MKLQNSLGSWYLFRISPQRNAYLLQKAEEQKCQSREMEVKRTGDLVKEISKQLLYSIAVIQQTNDVLWQWVAFQFYNTIITIIAMTNSSYASLSQQIWPNVLPTQLTLTVMTGAEPGSFKSSTLIMTISWSTILLLQLREHMTSHIDKSCAVTRTLCDAACISYTQWLYDCFCFSLRKAKAVIAPALRQSFID